MGGECKDSYAVEQIAQIGFATSILEGLQNLSDKTLTKLVWIHCDPVLSMRLDKKSAKSHFQPLITHQ